MIESGDKSGAMRLLASGVVPESRLSDALLEEMGSALAYNHPVYKMLGWGQNIVMNLGPSGEPEPLPFEALQYLNFEWGMAIKKPPQEYIKTLRELFKQCF